MEQDAGEPDHDDSGTYVDETREACEHWRDNATGAWCAEYVGDPCEYEMDGMCRRPAYWQCRMADRCEGDVYRMAQCDPTCVGDDAGTG